MPTFHERRTEQLRHRLTARALSSLPEPESWLDVDTGDGRFPEAARKHFPYTSFDGLDPTDALERALAADRIEEAYRGRLTTPGLAHLLRSRYDVVTILRPPSEAPDAELRAALAVLRPGGHVVLDRGWARIAAGTPACTVLPPTWLLPFLGRLRPAPAGAVPYPRTTIAAPATTSCTCSHSAPNAAFNRPSSSR